MKKGSLGRGRGATRRKFGSRRRNRKTKKMKKMVKNPERERMKKQMGDWEYVAERVRGGGH
jgi:hypothetical protein